MKVSVNWILYYNQKYQSSANPMPKGIDELVEKIGAQLGAVEEVIDFGKKYQGIVVAKVVSCVKHPNADKLSICLINDGKAAKNVKRNKDGLVEVVCGAPNVAAGQLVAWLPPGVTVPATIDKEPLVLEAREIRGVVSNGMIASQKELDLGDNHDGILVIDETAKPGQSLAEVYELDDYIIDIENKMFTHRPDCFGILGIARELAGIQHMVYHSPKWYLDKPTTISHAVDKKLLDVKNETPQLVPRFMMQVVKNIKVRPSPLWVQTYLLRIGIRPINNIVDTTNYVMYLTGQPLHAYDYDKVKSVSSGSQAKIIVRKAKKGEKLLLLGGKVLTLNGGEMTIATNKQAIGLAGVMGGAATEVDEKTQNIILEVGNFDMNETRKSAMAHGLFTDAATRFTKGQSPWQNDRVLAYALKEIISHSGGMPARHVYDLKGKLSPASPVKTTTSFINDRLGLQLSAQQIKKILENVEFKVTASAEKLKIDAPFWRTDIEIAEDVVEEVGRLYGYDHLPVELPPRDLSPAKADLMLGLKSKLREVLSAAGANEVLTYSFVHDSLLQKVGQDPKLAYHIKNAISPDLQSYRLSLTPSLLEKVHPNIKAGFDEFVLFEIGKGHNREQTDKSGLPVEFEMLSVVFASRNKEVKNYGAPFFQARSVLDYLAKNLKLELEYRPIEKEEPYQVVKPYDHERSAQVWEKHTNLPLGMVGEYKQSVIANLKLPPYSSGFEIGISELLKASASRYDYEPLNRFPQLSQDITLKVASTMTYKVVHDFIESVLNEASKDKGYHSNVEPLDIFQKESDKQHKQLSFRIVLYHPDRTLTTSESNKLLDKIATEAKAKLKAERI